MSEPNLFEFLRNRPTVSDLVGDNIYREQLPQHEFDGPTILDAVVFTRSGGQRTETFCRQDSLVAGTYTIDCLSPDPDRGKAIGDAIRRAMRDDRAQFSAPAVLRATLVADLDVGPLQEPGLYQRSLTFTLWYHED